MRGARRRLDGEAMRAVIRDRYGSPEVLRVEDVDQPAPDDGEVLVRVRAASLNTADLDNLRGRPLAARVGTGIFKPKTRTPGLDIAGEVEAVGHGVTHLVPRPHNVHPRHRRQPLGLRLQRRSPA